jgi:hypothetical protein
MKKILSIALLGASLAAHAQFAQITNGPNASNACPAASAPVLLIDSSTNVVSSCGKNGTAQTESTVLGILGPQTPVTTVTTAQTMASVALPANAQNYAGRLIRVCTYGTYTSPGTTAPVLTFSVVEGGITPVSIAADAASTTASTTLPFKFCANIETATLGATGTLEAHGELDVNLSANLGGAAVTRYLDNNTAASSAINLFAANTIAVKVAASLTITSVTARLTTVQLLN